MKALLEQQNQRDAQRVVSVARHSLQRRVKVDTTVVLLYNYTSRNVRQRNTMCGGPAKSLKLNTQL